MNTMASSAAAVGDASRGQGRKEGRQGEGGGKDAQEDRVGAEGECAVAEHEADAHPRRLREDGLGTQGPPPCHSAHGRRGISSVPPNSRVRSSMLSRTAW